MLKPADMAAFAELVKAAPQPSEYNFDVKGIDVQRNRYLLSVEEWLSLHMRVRHLKSFIGGYTDKLEIVRVEVGERNYVVSLTKWRRLKLEESQLLESIFKDIMNGKL